MGDRDDDDGRLRRHDAQDVRRHVRRVVLRAHRRPHHRTSGSGRSATTRHRTSGSGEREIARTRDQSSASALVSTVWSCLSLRLETTRFGRDSTPEIILAPGVRPGSQARSSSDSTTNYWSLRQNLSVSVSASRISFGLWSRFRRFGLSQLHFRFR